VWEIPIRKERINGTKMCPILEAKTMISNYCEMMTSLKSGNSSGRPAALYLGIELTTRRIRKLKNISSLGEKLQRGGT